MNPSPPKLAYLLEDEILKVNIGHDVPASEASFKSLNSDTLLRITGRGFGGSHAQNSEAI